MTDATLCGLVLEDLDESTLLADVEALLDYGRLADPPIDGFQLLDGVGSDNSASSNEASPVRKSKRAQKHHMYRVRIKNEREALQRQERELSKKLDQLEQRDNFTLDAVQAASYWKAVARQQEEERSCAEVEQKCLLQRVNNQAALIKALGGIAQRRGSNAVSRSRLEDGPGLSAPSHTNTLKAKSVVWQATAMAAHAGEAFAMRDYVSMLQMQLGEHRKLKAHLELLINNVECKQNTLRSARVSTYRETLQVIDALERWLRAVQGESRSHTQLGGDYEVDTHSLGGSLCEVYSKDMQKNTPTTRYPLIPANPAQRESARSAVGSVARHADTGNGYTWMESSSSSHSQAEETHNAVDKVYQRRKANKRKHACERDSLRQQVAELTVQLKRLQSSMNAENLKQKGAMTTTAAWKDLASYHMRARLLAEEQQRRLRDAIERRSSIIDHIGVAFRQRMMVEIDSSVSLSSVESRSLDVTMYRIYVAQLDEIYKQTDNVFREVGEQALVDTHGLYNPSRSFPAEEKFYQVVARSTETFPFAYVRSKVGRLDCMKNRPGSQFYSGPEISANTTIVKIRIAVPGTTSSLVQHAIARRYDEANRVVVVWRKVTEGGGMFAGMHSDEYGWNIVRPSPDGASTIADSIIRYIPLVTTGRTYPCGELKLFTDTIIRAREADLKWCRCRLNRSA